MPFFRILFLGLLCLSVPLLAGAQGITIKAEKDQQEQPDAQTPRVGSYLPPLDVVSASGQKLSLIRLRGKPALIEVVDMASPRAQAHAGGEPLGGVTPDADTLPLRDKIPFHARGIEPDDERFVHVRLLISNLDGTAPGPEDAKLWAEHYGIETSAHDWVVAGAPVMETNSGRRVALEPGFVLLDDKLIVQAVAGSDARPRALQDNILPMLNKLVQGAAFTGKATESNFNTGPGKVRITYDDLEKYGTDEAPLPLEEEQSATQTNRKEQADNAPPRPKLEGGKVYRVNAETFEMVVLRHEGLAVVDFCDADSDPCLQMAPILLRFAQTNEDVLVTIIDVEANRALARKYRVKEVPTLLFFSDGKPVQAVVGVAKLETMNELVEKHGR